MSCLTSALSNVDKKSGRTPSYDERVKSKMGREISRVGNEPMRLVHEAFTDDAGEMADYVGDAVLYSELNIRHAREC